MASKLGSLTMQALTNFNANTGKAWTLGQNWDNKGTEFETFVNNYLFPKINETTLVQMELGNRFDFLSKEIDFIGQFSEDYVIMDSVPVGMNLSQNEELMLKRNYPRMATKLFGAGIIKKQKFTLNNNDTRLNFSTLADAVGYALSIYSKKISDINVSEEQEIRAMLVDYANKNVKDVRTVKSEKELFEQVFEAILNIQNNSAKYNECSTASGGAIGRYTTKTKLKDVAILTTDKMKTFLLDTKLANTFQTAGIDISERITSFDDLGGVYKATKDIKITSEETIKYMAAFGDYQVRIGDVVPIGSVITYNVSELAEFIDNIEEVKPSSELFAYIFDIRKTKYRRFTKGMVKPPFYNGEFDESNHWIHFYSFKAISPFYNSVVVKGE